MLDGCCLQHIRYHVMTEVLPSLRMQVQRSIKSAQLSSWDLNSCVYFRRLKYRLYMSYTLQLAAKQRVNTTRYAGEIRILLMLATTHR